MGSIQTTDCWRKSQYLLTAFGSFVIIAMVSGCDISPIPTPIPGDEEGTEFAASGEGFDDPYIDDHNLEPGPEDLLPTEAGAEAGESLGDEAGDEAGDEMSGEEGGGEFIGGEDGQNEETDAPTTSDCDVVSAPDAEEELDAECDEEPESSFDVSPEEDDTLEGDAE